MSFIANFTMSLLVEGIANFIKYGGCSYKFYGNVGTPKGDNKNKVRDQ